MLQFKDIKQNSNVYILDKNTVEITTGKISSASFPKLEYNPQTGQQQMMITFGIEADGKSPTYSIPESASVVTAGDLIIATEKSGLLHDIEILNNTSDQFLANVDNLIEHHKMVNSVNGYDGAIFCRWTADAIGKAIKIDWEKFI